MSVVSELLDRNNQLFNAHDAAGIAELDHPDTSITVPGPAGRDERRGIDEGRKFNETWFEAFPDAKVTVVRRVIDGDNFAEVAIFEGTQTGTFRTPAGDIPPTGKTTRGEYVVVGSVKDGKFYRGDLFFDQMQLMVDLGLMPSPAASGA